MNAQWPVLIVILPFLFGLFATIIGSFKKEWALPTILVGLAGSFYSAIKTLCLVAQEGKIIYKMAGWSYEKFPIGIEYMVDHLNGTVLVMVTGVALLVAIFSKESVKQELPENIVPFYTLFSLLITGLAGMTITGDAFNLYVLLEISALSGYALLAFGRGRAYLATFNYLIMGSIGACFYLLGVGYVFLKTGHLNMAEISNVTLALHASKAFFVGFIFIMIGVWVKMAFFPLHSWLPNAYTYAPTATSCIAAPLMTKVSVYIMLRMMITVFSVDYVFNVLQLQQGIIILSIIAILVGSAYALLQRNVKKMLTYLIVAEIGYMVGGAWLGNQSGLIGATYHILADGLMTVCLFMAVGAITYKLGSSSFDKLDGVMQKMPLTMVGFLVAAFSMIGIPPTAGFFSKWYLIKGGIIAGQWFFVTALVISSFVNAILFFRIIEIAYFGNLKDGHGHETHKRNEAPLSMLIPLWISAIAIIGLGLYTSEVVTNFIVPIIPNAWL